MHYLLQYLAALGALLKEFWPLFLSSFIIAGLVQEFVSTGTMLRHFGRNTPLSIVKASFAGLFTSVCSCGAIPLAVVLRNKGATTANALTFLLASPWAGFTQLFILAGFVGIWNTGIIFVGAMLVALSTGSLLALYERRGLIEGAVTTPIDDHDTDCQNGSVPPFFRRILRGIGNTWSVMKEIGLYLAIGLLLAAGLQAFVPPDWVQTYLGNQAATGILVAIPIAAVLELCAEGFSVLAGQLYPMGASLGVVFAMLIVGVTTDFTELLVIYKRFGRRSAIAYLATATCFAVIVAYGIYWTISR